MLVLILKLFFVRTPDGKSDFLLHDHNYYNLLVNTVQYSSQCVQLKCILFKDCMEFNL